MGISLGLAQHWGGGDGLTSLWQRSAIPFLQEGRGRTKGQVHWAENNGSNTAQWLIYHAWCFGRVAVNARWISFFPEIGMSCLLGGICKGWWEKTCSTLWGLDSLFSAGLAGRDNRYFRGFQSNMIHIWFGISKGYCFTVHTVQYTLLTACLGWFTNATDPRLYSMKTSIARCWARWNESRGADRHFQAARYS